MSLRNKNQEDRPSAHKSNPPDHGTIVRAYVYGSVRDIEIIEAFGINQRLFLAAMNPANDMAEIAKLSR